MEKQYYADTVDENGVVHETVGENIRNGAKDPDSITNSFVENDDKVEFLDNMHISANYFKYALLTALTGQRIDYGYTFFAAFTDDQKQQIKNWLGIQSVDLGVIYPVGSVYIASNTTLDPSTFLPGTWEKIQPTEYDSMPHFVALYTGSRPDPGVVTEFQYDNNMGTSSVYYMTLVFWKRTA